MGLRYENLDEETRRLMIEEIEYDIANTGLYFSSYCNQNGLDLWPKLLEEAARVGSDETLANTLAQNNCFLSHHQKRKSKGGFTMAKVPDTAPQTLAEGQFNTYYMRALALRAINEGRALIVYRAKERDVPRQQSESMIGQKMDHQFVLDELRRTKGVNPDIRVPLPNTGITVRLV